MCVGRCSPASRGRDRGGRVAGRAAAPTAHYRQCRPDEKNEKHGLGSPIHRTPSLLSDVRVNGHIPVRAVEAMAEWIPPYDRVRISEDPLRQVLTFLESVY